MAGEQPKTGLEEQALDEWLGETIKRMMEKNRPLRINSSDVNRQASTTNHGIVPRIAKVLAIVMFSVALLGFFIGVIKIMNNDASLPATEIRWTEAALCASSMWTIAIGLALWLLADICEHIRMAAGN